MADNHLNFSSIVRAHLPLVEQYMTRLQKVGYNQDNLKREQSLIQSCVIDPQLSSFGTRIVYKQ